MTQHRGNLRCFTPPNTPNTLSTCPLVGISWAKGTGTPGRPLKGLRVAGGAHGEGHRGLEGGRRAWSARGTEES